MRRRPAGARALTLASAAPERASLLGDLDEQPGYTFPVWEPHVRLDYVFTPSAYADRINAVEVRKTPEATRSASDHFPLLVEIEER